MKKITKDGVVKNLLKLFAFCAVSELAFGIAAVAVAIVDNKRINKLVDNSDYETFNQKYIIEQTEELLDQYENGGLDKDQFNFDVRNIKDYDKEKYMLEHASPEMAAEYKEAKRIEAKNFSITMGGVGLCAAAAASAVGAVCVINKREEKRKTQENIKENESNENAEEI